MSVVNVTVVVGSIFVNEILIFFVCVCVCVFVTIFALSEVCVRRIMSLKNVF